MIIISRIRVETPTGCTGVAYMPPFCTRVAKTPSDRNRVAGTPPIGTKKRCGQKTSSEKETPKVVGSGPARPFYKDDIQSCGIGKDVARYFFKTPHCVTPP